MNNNLKKLWELEYLNNRGIPTSRQNTPSHALPVFLDFLDREGVRLEGKILDLGCGKGRNSLELLRNFQCEVYGIDISPTALQCFQSMAEKGGLVSKIHLTEGDLANPLPYPNEFFDFALDIATSFRLAEDEERHRYVQEVHRLLKLGGFLLLYVIATGDEYYEKFLISSPMQKERIFLDPKEQFPGRLYSKEELASLWGSKFSVRRVQELEFEGDIHGQKCIRHMILAVLQKPLQINT